jgi:endonuclease/exonuclease/phosphatase family metal-dependent hydrolase
MLHRTLVCFPEPLALATALAAVAACATPDPSAPAEGVGTSAAAALVDRSSPLAVRELSAFKALTYNTQFRPPIVDARPGDTAGSNRDIYGMEDSARARLIGEKIASSGADVVALQEVFRPDAYDSFIDTLAASYPDFTAYDDIFDENLYGSGMVLFSKLPMRSLVPVDGLRERRRCLRVQGDECFAELLEYEAQAQFEERVTRKGMGYARLQNAHTGRDLHVFFTHFESSGAEAETRGLQIAEAVPFMQERLEGRAGDDVLLLGDLNIIAPKVDQGSGQDTSDYDQHITEALGALGLADSWLAQSPEDEGFTFDAANNTANIGSARQRIDYHLVRSALAAPGTPALPRLCAQHAVVERELFRSDVILEGQQVLRDLSDHFAVSLVLAQEAAQCDPERARAMSELSDAAPSLSLPQQQISHPGNAQWYRFDAPGSYTVRAFRPDALTSRMRVRAFAATDLSTPLAPIEGSELVAARGGKVVYYSEQPFYVRVDSPEAGWRGGYTFTARKHQGANFDDAIVLSAGQPFAAAQMTAAVTQPLDRVHFRVRQRALASGQRQRHTFILDTAAALRMRLFDAQRLPLPGLVAAPPQTSLVVAPDASPVSGAAQDLFLAVDREGCATCQDAPFSITWTSDYRALSFGALTVLHQTEGLGQLEYDEVKVIVSLDGGPEQVFFVGELDQNAATYLSAVAPLGFRDTVKLRIIEDDVIIDDAFEPLVLSPEPTAGSAGGQLVHADLFATSGQGHYVLDYRVSL